MLATNEVLLDEFSKDFYMYYDVLQADRRDKDGGQMLTLLENRTCPSGIEEERGAGNCYDHGADYSLPRENPGCISLTIQVEATARDFVPHTHWVPFTAT